MSDEETTTGVQLAECVSNKNPLVSEEVLTEGRRGAKLLPASPYGAGEDLGQDASFHPDDHHEHGGHIHGGSGGLREGRGDGQAGSGWLREITGKRA